MNRRDFLKAGASVVVYFSFDGPRAFAQADAGKPVDPSEVDSFLAIHPGGTVTVFTSKVDVGTGLRIAVAQMAAEELGIPVEQVTVVDGDTATCPDQGGTGGSTGLTRGGMEVRQAAATARQALEASGVTLASLAGRPLSLKVDPKAPLRSASAFTAIGKSSPRPDVPAKCTGTRTYVHDVTLPNMLHARVIRPNAMGATLAAVDESSIAAIPGVRVVRVRDFLAVASKDEWAAIRASRELKATWTESATLPGSDGLDRWTRNGQEMKAGGSTIYGAGNPDRATTSAANKYSATYFWPYQSHASLGPSCAVADIHADGGGTVWSASQGTHGLRGNLAKVFGLDASKLRVIFADGSGSYGTNGGDHAAADAVLLSKTLGQPVRVQWSREDETGWDPKGPQQLLDISAGLDASGHIVVWETHMWLSNNAPGSRALLAADAVGLPQEHGQGAGAITQNAEPPYASDNGRVVVHWIAEAPLQLSNLRAPGKIANVFAVESFTDELAFALHADPVEFRLSRLHDPRVGPPNEDERRRHVARAREAIERAARTFGWTPRPSPNPQAQQGDALVGRGFSYMRYKQAENYVAMAMEVAVNPKTGQITVRRVVCAHDCGLVVNPDALKNQIEGCIVQTISRTLHEEVTFDRSRVTSVDWASYPILRFPEAPSVELILIDRPDQPLLGAGEASTAPVAAAVANAVFDATGARLRSVPFTAARVKAALVSRSTA